MSGAWDRAEEDRCTVKGRRRTGCLDNGVDNVGGNLGNHENLRLCLKQGHDLQVCFLALRWSKSNGVR